MILSILLWGFSMAVAGGDALDFDSLWNYEKPAETEKKFRQLVPMVEKTGSLDLQLQLQTQLARCNSLQKNFGQAHALLDAVEKKLNKETPVAEVRYALERGRTFHSDKKLPQGIEQFQKAFSLAVERHYDFYAVDAAHMLAIAEKDPEKQMEWNLKAVKMAESSDEVRAQGWLGSLYNNIGWTYHDTGKFSEALKMFEKALAFREAKADASNVRFAKWCIARTLRSLNRVDDALKLQRALELEFSKLPERDGFVFEELAELLSLQKKDDEAKKYFALAFDELSKDLWFKENEPARFARIKEKAGK